MLTAFAVRQYAIPTKEKADGVSSRPLIPFRAADNHPRPCFRASFRPAARVFSRFRSLCRRWFSFPAPHHFRRFLPSPHSRQGFNPARGRGFRGGHGPAGKRGPGGRLPPPCATGNTKPACPPGSFSRGWRGSSLSCLRGP